MHRFLRVVFHVAAIAAPFVLATGCAGRARARGSHAALGSRSRSSPVPASRIRPTIPSSHAHDGGRRRRRRQLGRPVHNSDAQPTVAFAGRYRDLLLARLTYELIEDSDYKGARRSPDGQVVAAFNIESHFDVVYEYNPTTGERINVLEENETDRPWYERESFRVDWSRNLITDAYDLDALSQLGIWYGVEWDPVAYDVTDPSNPDAPQFATGEGYFDVTLKAWAAPQIVHDAEWGDYPACWLYGRWPMDNCNPSEVTLRMSFLRVVDRDYEPVEWDGTKMDMFGWFTWDRFGYDRRYGVVDDRWRRFSTMWNLYERSHVEPAIPCNTEATTPLGADPHRDADGDGTEDECATAGRGSRCAAVVGECPLPMRDAGCGPSVVRERRYPEELFEAGRRALDGWAYAIRAVVAAWLAECRRTVGSGCESERFADAVERRLRPARLGVHGGAARLRALPQPGGRWRRPGVRAAGLAAHRRPALQPADHRFPQQMAVGDRDGREDPLTGEKLAGSANQWLSVADRAASQLADISTCSTA